MFVSSKRLFIDLKKLLGLGFINLVVFASHMVWFVATLIHPCLSIAIKTITMIFLFYVDDIILSGSCPSILHNFISLLSHKFAMKDLGDLSYFLGIQVVQM